MSDTLTSTLEIIDKSSKVLNAISEAATAATAATDGLIASLGAVSGVRFPEGIQEEIRNIGEVLNAISEAAIGATAATDGLIASLGAVSGVRFPEGIQDEIQNIQEEIRNLQEEMRNTGNESERTQNRSQGAFSNMAADLAHVVQAAQGVYVVMSKIGNMASGAISNGDEIAKTARALHINAQAYQELDYAAQRGGASHEEYVQSLKTLDVQLAQLQSGSNEVARAFRQIGISKKDLAGKDLEGTLYAISDALNQMEDKSEAAKVANTLLGGAGYKTASAFAVGAEELDKLRQEARETGTIMDDMTLEEAEHGADELLNVQLQIQSIWQRISVAVMPAVIKVLEKIDSLFNENAGTIDQITSFIGQLADNVLPSVMQLIGVIMRNVQNVLSFVMPYIPSIMDFVGTIIEGVGILIDEFGGVIIAIGGIAAGLMAVKAVMAAIAANPIMAIIAGTVAIISFIVAMQKKSEEFYAVCVKIGTGIAMIVDTLVSVFVGSWQTIGNAIGRVWSLITGAIMKGFGAALGWLADKWNAFVEWIGLDGLKADTEWSNDVEKSGDTRFDDATDFSKDFYFDASGTFDGLADRLSMGMADMDKTGKELGWEEPTNEILKKMDAQMSQSKKNNDGIMGALNGGVKIDKDSILFMKEMATAEVINRYNEFSPNITQSFNSNQPFEPGQIERLSGRAIDGAMAGMRTAI